MPKQMSKGAKSKYRHLLDDSRLRTMFFVSVFAIGGIVLLLAVRAATSTAFFEAENAATKQGVQQIGNTGASNGSYLQFGSGPITGNGPTLPAPITVAGRDFGTILKSYPNGGTIVLPDGDYRVGDVANFNPTNFLVVVAQNPGKARVVRTASTIGSTDQLFSNSSNMIFVGVNFHQITTNIQQSSNDIYFWYTKHSYPVTAHPTPTQTVCGPGNGPVGFEFGSSTRLGLYGVDIIDIGHDGVKINTTSFVTIKGAIIDQLSHKNLQNGNGNASCGWSGNDNYHTDAVQIHPGGGSNLTIENSFLGQRLMLQAEGSGATSNKNIVLRNNSSREGGERLGHSCIGIDARVKPTAPAGTTMDMTISGFDVYCHNTTEWIFAVQDGRENVFTVNGEMVRSADRQANRFLNRIVGSPPAPADTKVKPWRDANPYNSWHCFFDTLLANFNNTYGSCG